MKIKPLKRTKKLRRKKNKVKRKKKRGKLKPMTRIAHEKNGKYIFQETV